MRPSLFTESVWGGFLLKRAALAIRMEHNLRSVDLVPKLSSGDVMIYEPNKPHASNPAMTLLISTLSHGRGVADAERWANGLTRHLSHLMPP
jgi:hypothetical protein